MSTTGTIPEEERDEQVGSDPFKPFHDNKPASGPVLTLRALVVGILCGILVNASNIYLGLKAGWTSSTNIFGVSCHIAIPISPSTTKEKIPLLDSLFSENGPNPLPQGRNLGPMRTTSFKLRRTVECLRLGHSSIVSIRDTEYALQRLLSHRHIDCDRRVFRSSFCRSAYALQALSCFAKCLRII